MSQEPHEPDPSTKTSTKILLSISVKTAKLSWPSGCWPSYPWTKHFSLHVLIWLIFWVAAFIKQSRTFPNTNIFSWVVAENEMPNVLLGSVEFCVLLSKYGFVYNAWTLLSGIMTTVQGSKKYTRERAEIQKISRFETLELVDICLWQITNYNNINSWNFLSINE